jgi:hypothetical protein
MLRHKKDIRSNPLRKAFYIKIDSLVFGFVGDNTKKE